MKVLKVHTSEKAVDLLTKVVTQMKFFKCLQTIGFLKPEKELLHQKLGSQDTQNFALYVLEICGNSNNLVHFLYYLKNPNCKICYNELF